MIPIPKISSGKPINLNLSQLLSIRRYGIGYEKFFFLPSLFVVWLMAAVVSLPSPAAPASHRQPAPARSVAQPHTTFGGLPEDSQETISTILGRPVQQGNDNVGKGRLVERSESESGSHRASHTLVCSPPHFYYTTLQYDRHEGEEGEEYDVRTGGKSPSYPLSSLWIRSPYLQPTGDQCTHSLTSVYSTVCHCGV